MSGSPSASLEALPFKVTNPPGATVWLGPALASGAEFPVVTVISATSVPKLLVTVSRTIQVPPTTSGVKLAITSDELMILTDDPGGREVKVQLYCRKPPPAGVLDPLPLSETARPTGTV